MPWLARALVSGLMALIGCMTICAQTSLHDSRPRTASISGRVTIGGKPAVNATVNIYEHDEKVTDIRTYSSGGQEVIDQHYYRTTTDADGRYQIGGLPPGDYRISALSLAFVPEGRSDDRDGFRQLRLDEGEVREKVDFALIRGGVITGRITDEDGAPEIHRYVRLKLLLEDGQKQDIYVNFPGWAFTDDRGIYRLFGLREGRYILYAGGESEAILSTSGNRAFRQTFYPDATNEEQAKVIELKQGDEVVDVNIKLQNLGKTFEAAGRVINAETGKPIPSAQVYCASVNDQESLNDNGKWYGYGMSDLQGRFRITGIVPGKYLIRLSDSGWDNTYYSELKYFEVESEDVEGLEIIVKLGGTVRGSVVFEDSRQLGSLPKLPRLLIFGGVTREVTVGDKKYNNLLKWIRSEIGPDGSFQMIGLPPGKVTIENHFSGIRGVYVLRIERDGIDVKSGFELAPKENISGVRIVAGYGDASLRGVLNIAGGTLPEGIAFVASINQQEGSGKGANVDEKGRFIIEDLLPGEYELSIYPFFKRNIPSNQMPKLPPLKQRINLTGGVETKVTLTYDLSNKGQ